MKSSLGAGILSLPNAFNNAGLVFGAFAIVTTGIIYTHCIWILVSTSHKICEITKTPTLRYAEIAGKVFERGPPWARRCSPVAKAFIDYSFMVGNVLCDSVYIVFISNTFYGLGNSLLGWQLSLRVYVLIVLIPVIFIGQIRTLKCLVPFSGLANTFIITTLLIVFYHVFKEPLVFDDKPLIVSWTKWPFFFTTTLYALDGIGVIIPVENSMKKPQEFLGKPYILLIAMILIIILYLFTGLFGFVRYGSTARGSITLNLPTNEWSGIAGQTLIALGILLTFGLSFYVPMEILFKKIGHLIKKNRNLSEIFIRTLILACMGGITLLIPDIGIFISLVGSFYSSLLSMFMPALIETVFLHSNDGFGVFKWKLWKNLLIMLLALIACSTGTFSSLKSIIETFK